MSAPRLQDEQVEVGGTVAGPATDRDARKAALVFRVAQGASMASSDALRRTARAMDNAPLEAAATAVIRAIEAGELHADALAAIGIRAAGEPVEEARSRALEWGSAVGRCVTLALNRAAWAHGDEPAAVAALRVQVALESGKLTMEALLAAAGQGYRDARPAPPTCAPSSG